MSKLGYPVVYSVHDGHKTETVKGDETISGSIHHHEMTEFAGVIGREHADGTADIHLHVPNKEGRWVERVPEGTGPHTYRAL